MPGRPRQALGVAFAVVALMLVGCRASGDPAGSERPDAEPTEDGAGENTDPATASDGDPGDEAGDAASANNEPAPDEPTSDGPATSDAETRSDRDTDAPPDTTGEGDGTATVEVFFTNPDLDGAAGTQVFPLERTVETPAVLRGALEALLAGPTDTERSLGYTSWFSADTAGMLREVRLEDGVAEVDLDASLPEVIPNASTSAGSAALLGALEATATQFDTVDEVLFTLEGDVDAFYLWLQLVPPR